MGFSLENRGNGSWRVTVCGGYSGARKNRLHRTVRVDPNMTIKAQEREVSKLAAEIETDLHRHKLTMAKKITLKDYSKIWMESYVRRRNLSPRTIFSYRNLLESRILPALGHYYIQDITPAIINRFMGRLSKEPPKNKRSQGKTLSGTFLRKYYGLLHGMFERATKWQYISINPVAAVDAPAVDTKEFTPYTDEQVVAMLDALSKEDLQWRALFTLAIYSQMRRGELVGLNWSAVDFEKKCVGVRQSACYIPGKGQILKAPKTASGKRTVTLPDSVMQLLKEHKSDQNLRRLAMGDTWMDQDAVFTQWNGVRMSVDTPSSKFRKFLKANDLPIIRLHDLRHTGVTLLVSGDNPMDPVTISKRIGHARTSTTMDIYSHAFAKQEQRAAELLEETFSSARDRIKSRAK